MTKRRSLVSHLRDEAGVDPSQEAAFVYGAKVSLTGEPRAIEEPPSPPRQPAAGSQAQADPEPIPAPPVVAVREPQSSLHAGRVPLTTRIKPDLAQALKRASLERQLAGLLPNTVQDILEEALEPWLRQHGFLKQ